jgi:hypothetical protein
VAQASLRVPLQLPHAQLRAAEINFGPHLIVGADGEASGGGVTVMRESAKGECAEKGRGEAQGRLGHNVAIGVLRVPQHCLSERYGVGNQGCSGVWLDGDDGGWRCAHGFAGRVEELEQHAQRVTSRTQGTGKTKESYTARSKGLSAALATVTSNRKSAAAMGAPLDQDICPETTAGEYKALTGKNGPGVVMMARVTWR